MERERGRFTGVRHVFYFNRHYYSFAAASAICLFAAGRYMELSVLNVLAFLIFAQTLVSLFVSFYVYDLSKLYSFEWLNDYVRNVHGKGLNLHAGFDETSDALKAKFPDLAFFVFDFYNEKLHTEISIKRARDESSQDASVTKIDTSSLPVPDNSFDHIFVIFAAHEIRDDDQRIEFFRELRRTVKGSGNILVTEHIRDIWNFLAYSIGVRHFHSKTTWDTTFRDAGLRVSDRIKITPFITTFVLEKHGIAP